MMPKKKEPTEAATKETKTTAAKTSKTAAAPVKAAKSEATAAPKTAKPATKVEKPSAASSTSTTAKTAKPAAKAEKPTAVEKPADEQNPIITVIVAKFDVGHGNNLYIRGDGHSLSWESGTLMENTGGDTWQWTTTEAREGVLGFKLLINDQIWAVGENMNASFGETMTFYPSF